MKIIFRSLTRIESLFEYFYETLCLSCYKCLLLKFLFKNEPCGIKGQVRVTFCKLQCNALIATSSYLQYQGVEQKSRHILFVLVLGWLNYFFIKYLLIQNEIFFEKFLTNCSKIPCPCRSHPEYLIELNDVVHHERR